MSMEPSFRGIPPNPRITGQAGASLWIATKVNGFMAKDFPVRGEWYPHSRKVSLATPEPTGA